MSQRPWPLLPFLLLFTSVMSRVAAADSAPAPTPLSAAQAVELALQSHPLLRAAEARVARETALVAAARLLPNPELTLQHGVGKDTGGLDEDILASQTIELGGKRSSRWGEARQQRERALAELQALRLQVAHDTRLAYLELQQAVGLRNQTQRFLSLAERFRDTAQEQFKAGEVPETRVLRATLEVNSRRLLLDQAETELKVRARALNSLMGKPLGEAVAPSDALEPLPVGPPLEQWKSMAESQPGLAAARAELAARQAALRGARAASIPDLVLTGTHAAWDVGSGSSIRVGLVLPLWDWGSLRARRAEARASIAEQEAQVAEELRLARTDVDTAYARAAEAAARVDRYREGQLALSRRLADLVREGYDAGMNGYLELLDAQTALQESESGYLQAMAEEGRAVLDLQRAAGSQELLGTASPKTAPQAPGAVVGSKGGPK